MSSNRKCLPPKEEFRMFTARTRKRTIRLREKVTREQIGKRRHQKTPPRVKLDFKCQAFFFVASIL